MLGPLPPPLLFCPPNIIHIHDFYLSWNCGCCIFATHTSMCLVRWLHLHLCNKVV